MRLEALGAERDPVDAVLPQQRGEAGRDGLGVRLDRYLARPSASAASRRASAAGSVNVGVPPPRKTVSSIAREMAALELQLGEQRVDVAAVLAVVSDDGDEVAVAAPVGAERQVHVEVADAPVISSRRRPG